MGHTAFMSNPIRRQFRRIAPIVAGLILCAAMPGTVHATVPKMPVHKEYRDILKNYKKSVNTRLQDFKVALATLILHIRLGTEPDPVGSYSALFDTVITDLEDFDTQLEAAILALNIQHPEDAIFGDPQGDFSRFWDYYRFLTNCFTQMIRENAQPLQKIKDKPLKVAVQADDIHDVVAIVEPVNVTPPEKRVVVKWTVAGRDAANPDDGVRLGGVAPAGSTVNVTLDCGNGSTATTQVTADAKCHWRASFDQVPVGNCRYTVSNVAHPNNNSSDKLSVP